MIPWYHSDHRSNVFKNLGLIEIQDEEIIMITEEHFRRLEQMYLGAPCNEYYQPKIKIERGIAEVIIPIQPKFFHAAKAAHGSIYFKAIDDAAYFAVNSLVPDVFVLTVSLNVQLIKPISEGSLKCSGKVIYFSSRFYFAEAIAYNSEGREIARGTGNFVKSNIALSPEIGYKL